MRGRRKRRYGSGRLRTARTASAARNRGRTGGSIFGPQLNHQTIGIDELGRDDIDGTFEIEDDASGAVVDLGDANLLETMIADQDGFGAMMRGSRGAETVEVVVEARRIFDLIRCDLISTLRLDGDSRDVAEGPEADGFNVRIDSGRLGVCETA